MNQDDFQKLLYLASKEITKKKAKYYDDEINTPILKITKAIVPYLDLKSQKQMAVIIKIIEIQRLYDLYEQKDLQRKSDDIKNIDDIKNNFDFNGAIINAIKAYLENAKPNKQSQENFQENNNKIKNDIIESDKKISEQNIFDDEVFKDLSDSDKNFLKKFLNDVSDKSKSTLEIFNIMLEYNQKMPKSFSDKQKNVMIHALIKKLSPDKQTQFFDLYKTFFNEK